MVPRSVLIKGPYEERSRVGPYRPTCNSARGLVTNLLSEPDTESSQSEENLEFRGNTADFGGYHTLVGVLLKKALSRRIGSEAPGDGNHTHTSEHQLETCRGQSAQEF